MKLAEVTGLFTLANIPILHIRRLPNRYITSQEDESDDYIRQEAVYRHRSPSWLGKTPWGHVDIGWRKRVIEIDWSDTHVRQVITTDDVTKCETSVHAYSEERALVYLKALNGILRNTSYNHKEAEISEALVERCFAHVKANHQSSWSQHPGMTDAGRRLVLRSIISVVLSAPVDEFKLTQLGAT